LVTSGLPGTPGNALYAEPPVIPKGARFALA
jgi:hypothetical protein